MDAFLYFALWTSFAHIVEVAAFFAGAFALIHFSVMIVDFFVDSFGGKYE